METTLTSGQLELQLKLFREKRMTPKRWNRILASGIFADLCDLAARLDRRDDVRKTLMDMAPKERQYITVDYNCSLGTMVHRGGYDWVEEGISPKYFPLEGSGRRDFATRLFHFDNDISPDDAADGIAGADTANPWVPGKIEHLLAYGAKYPEEQREYEIHGLGSPLVLGDLKVYRNVPCLSAGNGGKRERWVFIRQWGDMLNDPRFLAVRPVIKTVECLSAS